MAFTVISQNPWENRPLFVLTGTGLIPEFDLSIPAAGDDLGGLVRVPQGTDAHLVVSLDPVVELGGLPVPDVQLPVRISRYHIAADEKQATKQRVTKIEGLGLWFPCHLLKGGTLNLGLESRQGLQRCHGY